MEITMQKDISRIFIESVLNKALKEINKSPRRTARNLIDMGVNSRKDIYRRFFCPTFRNFYKIRTVLTMI